MWLFLEVNFLVCMQVMLSLLLKYKTNRLALQNVLMFNSLVHYFLMVSKSAYISFDSQEIKIYRSASMWVAVPLFFLD